MPPIEPSEEPVEAVGEEVCEPEVPVDEGFEVKRVVRLPEDTSVRDAIREEFEGPAHRSRMDLGDTGVGRPAVSRGHKGRGNKSYE